MSPPEPPRPPKPPPPPPETMQGIGEGIYDLQRRDDERKKQLVKIEGGLADVHDEVLYQGVEIRKLKKTQEAQGVKLDDTVERVTELERLPRARPPYPSLKDLSDVDDEDRTSPGGHVREEVFRHRQAMMERTLSDMREKLDGEERARLIEKERADATDAERKRVARDAKTAKDEADAKAARDATAAKERTSKWVKIAGAAGPGAIAVWEVARWVLVHVFHF